MTAKLPKATNSRPAREVIFFLLLACLTLPLQALGQQSSEPFAWHHNGSPFRAIFTLTSAPSPASAGYLLEVPIFDLGHPEGYDVYCYDSRGKQLRRADLGSGRPDHVLIHVQPVNAKLQVCAYFGSKRRAPVAKVEHQLPLAELYALPKGQLNNWAEVQAGLANAKKIGGFSIDRLEAAVNPLDSTEQFIMVLTASMTLRKRTTRNFFLACSDAGYLLIDNVLHIERNGRNSVHSSRRGENRVPVTLAAGMHTIKLVGINFADQFALSLGEWFSAPRVAPVAPAEFIQAGASQLQQVEARRAEAGCPLFHYQHLSYMGLEEGQLTETTMSTWSGQEAEWLFGDGLKMRGATVRRIFPGLKSVPVRVTVRRGTCSGSINFPGQAPPRQYLATRAANYQHYEQILQAAGFAGIRDQDALRLLLAFFQRRDFHPAQARLCEALLASRALAADERLNIMLTLARATALEEPNKTLRAYSEIFKTRLNSEQMSRHLPEAIDFAIFRMRDCTLAEQLLKRNETRLPRNSERLIAGMKFDIALQSGNLEEAKNHYAVMMTRKRRAEEQKTAAVQGNALQEMTAVAIAEGRLLEAEQALREWLKIAPQDRGNGAYSLLKSRLLRQKGWQEGALGELTGAILADPLLPNLPEVEFEKAEIMAELGDQKQAREIFARIKTEYPNHPLASKAAQKLK